MDLKDLTGKTVKSIKRWDSAIEITFTDGTILDIKEEMVDYVKHILEVEITEPTKKQ